MKSLIFLVFLTSCILVPEQNFNENQEFFKKANPSLSTLSSEELKAQTERHKVLIGILDSGVDYNHIKLKEHLRFNNDEKGIGYDVLGEDYFPYPIVLNPKTGEVEDNLFNNSDHGTHVASLALLGAYLTLPSTGKRESIKKYLGLISVRAFPLSSKGVGELNIPFDEISEPENKFKMDTFVAQKAVESLNKSIIFAVDEGANIINMSLGIDADEMHPKTRPIYIEKIKREFLPLVKDYGRNVLFTFAAGNESKKVVEGIYPAFLNLPNTITVGALKRNDEIAYYTNYGENVEVYIRGSHINALVFNNSRGVKSGTSMAAPLVANLAAKIKLLAPCALATDLKRIILETSKLEELTLESKKEFSPIKRKVRIVSFKKALEKAESFCL